KQMGRQRAARRPEFACVLGGQRHAPATFRMSPRSGKGKGRPALVGHPEASRRYVRFLGPSYPTAEPVQAAEDTARRAAAERGDIGRGGAPISSSPRAFHALGASTACSSVSFPTDATP